MSSPKPKRARAVLTAKARRTIIMVALDGAGIERVISAPVAHAVWKLPTNGVMNERALAEAIREAIPRQRALHAAHLVRSGWRPAPPPPPAPPARSGLRLIVGGRS